MKPKKFFFLWPHDTIEKVFKKEGHSITYSPLEKHDGVVLAGFLPICPMLYGQAPIAAFPSTMLDLQRDRTEWRMLRSLDFKKPKIGIGRGAHMLNVYSGGDMWQHVDGHMEYTNGHTVLLEQKDQAHVSSLHSQMMLPSDHARVLVTARRTTKLFKEGNVTSYTKDYDKWDDPEVVYYKHTNSLCFQPTPGLSQFQETDALLHVCMEYTQF
jgi:hypothetical protein